MIKTAIEDCGYEELVDKARQAAENAYCPYSKYRVGAAVLTSDGRIFTGCNIENGSYSATVCAERTAIFKAVSEGAKHIAAVAVAAEEGEPPAFPCGVCRQVMSEFCSPDTHVLVYDGERSVYDFALNELLPFAFEIEKG